MAGTTGIVNGTKLRIFIGTPPKAIAYATTCNVEMSAELRESVTKDTPGGGATGWATVRRGQKSATLSGEGLVAMAEDSNTNNKPMTDLFTLFNNGTTFAVRFSTDTVGDTYFSGNGVLTQLSIDSAAEEDASYSFQIRIDGPITPVVQAA